MIYSWTSAFQGTKVVACMAMRPRYTQARENADMLADKQLQINSVMHQTACPCPFAESDADPTHTTYVTRRHTSTPTKHTHNMPTKHHRQQVKATQQQTFLMQHRHHHFSHESMRRSLSCSHLTLGHRDTLRLRTPTSGSAPSISTSLKGPHNDAALMPYNEKLETAQ